MLHDYKVLSGGGNTGIKHQTNNAISISKKMFMFPVKIVRSLFAVFLTCVIALNCFISPAFAATSSSDFADTGSVVNSFVKDFLQEFAKNAGSVAGGVAGLTAICYASDVFIAPVAPPVAVYLATVCSGIGSTLGIGGTVVSAKIIKSAHL